MAIDYCQSCGACCASYRVSFYWGETSLMQDNGTPDELTEKLDYHRVAMRGTNQQQPYCIALQGEIGKRVACTVYDNRPSPCREFDAGTERCFAARQRHGLNNTFEAANA